MKAVVQRVKCADVKIDGQKVGSCNEGYMILFCAVEGDEVEDISLLAKKVAMLRIFCDENDKMNKSILDVGGEILCISQFTLAADTKKGNRPSFIKAMPVEKASQFYDEFCEELLKLGVKKVDKGIFGADMQVSLINDGPVTICLDTDIWTNREKT
ncbi:MAG: D-tyrosyl-tRNA(Tyr) deacylase [Clostridia bacterium]|nr:D-tyrosyl-tRNA(Tyr) deacylase [Clostridia bacterium]